MEIKDTKKELYQVQHPRYGKELVGGKQAHGVQNHVSLNSEKRVQSVQKVKHWMEDKDENFINKLNQSDLIELRSLVPRRSIINNCLLKIINNFWVDRLPPFPKEFPITMLINTNGSTQLGEHWLGSVMLLLWRLRA